MPFITKQGLKQLDAYKYKGGAYSWLDNKMNPFWEWSVTLLPMNMAPNLVTFVGWLLVVASYSVILYHDYTFKKEIPRWTFFFAAVCIFMYSTLDAIDGKQARRTKSSSPLGQLFDHGCDSFSVSFFILGACQATRLNPDQVFILFCATKVAFWISNWIEYHTGVLMTNINNFGVTECQFSLVLIHLITSVFGQTFWDITLYEGILLKTVVSYFFAVTILTFSAFAYVKTLVEAKEEQRMTMIGEWAPITLTIIMMYIWMNLSIYKRYNGIILINFGVLTSLIISKMIICSVTHMQFKFFHNECIVFLVSTILMVHFNQVENERAMVITFWVCFAINVLSILKFLYATILQITDYLGIYCFSLQKKARKLD